MTLNAKQMQELSLKARYKKYGGKEAFRKFMQGVGKKGGLATQEKKRENLTK